MWIMYQINLIQTVIKETFTNCLHPQRKARPAPAGRLGNDAFPEVRIECIKGSVVKGSGHLVA